jgi:putative membrane protein
MHNALKKITALLPALFASAPAWAQVNEGRPGYWHHGMDWGWGHMIFGGAMMIAFWGGIIVLVVLAIRWLGRNADDQTPPASISAMDILNERFARGEIEKEEYEDRKKLLSS